MISFHLFCETFIIISSIDDFDMNIHAQHLFEAARKNRPENNLIFVCLLDEFATLDTFKISRRRWIFAERCDLQHKYLKTHN